MAQTKLFTPKEAKQDYVFVEKVLYIPKLACVAIGDLHIGYDAMLAEAGLQISLNIAKQISQDLKRSLAYIENTFGPIKTIIFLGDVKHFYTAEYEEKKAFFKILNVAQQFVKKSTDIMLIKGNHDTYSLTAKKMREVIVLDDWAFLHGHEGHPEAFDQNIKHIAMAHLHPSVTLSDGAKKEKYKCFLSGTYKKKEVVVLPSFMNIVEGTSVNDQDFSYENFYSILPERTLKNMVVHAIGELTDEEIAKGKVAEVLTFDKVKKL